MPSEWYCQIDGTECGPLTSGQLRKIALDGRLSRKAFVRKGSSGGWLQADRLKGLFDPRVPETAPAFREAPIDTDPIRRRRVKITTLAACFGVVLLLGILGWRALKGSGTKPEAANLSQVGGAAPTPNGLAAKDETSRTPPDPTAPRVGTETASGTSPVPTPKADSLATAPRSATAPARKEDRSIETTNRSVAPTAAEKQPTARLAKDTQQQDDDKTSRDDQEGSWRVRVVSSSTPPPGQSVTIWGQKLTPKPNRRFVEVSCLIEPRQAENRFFDTSEVFLTPGESGKETKLNQRSALIAFGSSRDKGRPPSPYWPVNLRMLNSSVESGKADEKVQFDVTMKKDQGVVVGALLVAPKDRQLPVSLLFEAEPAPNGDWTLHFAGQRLHVDKGGDGQIEAEIKKEDRETFQGKWTLTNVELDAPGTTGFGGEAARKLMSWTFKGDTLKITGEGANGGLSYRTVWRGDRLGLFSLNRAKEFRFRLDESGLPRTIDVMAGNSTLHGNYSWDGEQLKVCLNLSDGKAPGVLEVKKGTNHALFVLEKEIRPPGPAGRPPATVKPGKTPAFRRREAAPDAPKGWPAFSGSLSGRIEVRISNPNEFAVTAGLRLGKKGKDFSIPAGATRSVYVPNGRYDIYFRYSNDDEGIYQGDSFTLAGNGVEIQIVKRTDGNYGIRKVK